MKSFSVYTSLHVDHAQCNWCSEARKQPRQFVQLFCCIWSCYNLVLVAVQCLPNQNNVFCSVQCRIQTLKSALVFFIESRFFFRVMDGFHMWTCQHEFVCPKRIQHELQIRPHPIKWMRRTRVMVTEKQPHIAVASQTQDFHLLYTRNELPTQIVANLFPYLVVCYKSVTRLE
jgi:hypothetical protein